MAKSTFTKYIKWGLVLLLNLSFIVHGLVTVPVNDDLLGPGQCPTGSFCIDTQYCSDEFYTTKSGLPFYCGPNHQIDSMICCISTVATVVKPLHVSEQRLDPESFDFNDLEHVLRTNRSTTDDDEVDILSVPYATNQMDENPYDEISLPNSNAELEGRFDTPRDLEAMLEDVIDQDLTTSEQEKGSENIQENSEKSTENDLKTHSYLDGVIEKNNDAGPAGEGVEARAQATPNLPIKTACACEKGERGPKGEPGEPGKIIYIPVFVGNNGYSNIPPPPSNPTGIPPGSVPFNPAFLYSQPLGQNQGQPLPQHPNPTIIPYNVPINPPPGNVPPPQPVPVMTPTPHPPQQQPQFPQQAQPIHASMPFVDDLQARLTRQSVGQRHDLRRYHRR